VGSRAKRTPVSCTAIEHISLSSYNDLKKRGLAPEELHPIGTKIHRITREAHVAWRQRMVELAQSDEAKLEAQRRSKFAKIAGDIAAESPLHVSEVNRQRKRRRARATKWGEPPTTNASDEDAAP
jgi:hypothetical protein